MALKEEEKAQLRRAAQGRRTRFDTNKPSLDPDIQAETGRRRTAKEFGVTPTAPSFSPLSRAPDQVPDQEVAAPLGAVQAPSAPVSVVPDAPVGAASFDFSGLPTRQDVDPTQSGIFRPAGNDGPINFTDAPASPTGDSRPTFDPTTRTLSQGFNQPAPLGARNPDGTPANKGGGGIFAPSASQISEAMAEQNERARVASIESSLPDVEELRKGFRAQGMGMLEARQAAEGERAMLRSKALGSGDTGKPKDQPVPKDKDKTKLQKRKGELAEALGDGIITQEQHDDQLKRSVIGNPPSPYRTWDEYERKTGKDVDGDGQVGGAGDSTAETQDAGSTPAASTNETVLMVDTEGRTRKVPSKDKDAALEAGYTLK